MHGNQPNTFQIGRRVNSHFVLLLRYVPRDSLVGEDLNKG